MKNPEKLWQVILKVGILFIATFCVYFAVATKGTFVITQDLDYFNLQAQAFLQGRLDLPNPIFTDELSLYNNKWYLYYGPLPAIPLAILQWVTGRIFIPTIYLNVLVGSLNVCIIYLILRQVRKDFFPYAPRMVAFIGALLFAFGTVHFWLSVRSGLWFVAQTHSFLMNAVGLFFVLRKKPSFIYYFFSTVFIATNFFGRVFTVALLIVPITIFLFSEKNHWNFSFVRKLSAILVVPLIIFGVFLIYNTVRFGEPWETGFKFQKFHQHYLSRFTSAGGWFHLKNIPENLWYMFLETPKLTVSEQHEVQLIHNPEGNSIFYLTPPFFSVLLVWPFKKKRGLITVDPLLLALWLGLIATLIPILMLSGTGWQQFGYRYTLDVTIPLLLLSLMGMKMKPNFLYSLGILFAVFVQTLGALYA